jgi:hypothetical protein
MAADIAALSSRERSSWGESLSMTCPPFSTTIAKCNKNAKCNK